MSFKALGKNIIFTFPYKSYQRMFVENSETIIIAGKNNETVGNPRWGIVVSAGSDCDTVKDGDVILIEGLKWTNVVIVDGVKYWRTNEDSVLAIGDHDSYKNTV